MGRLLALEHTDGNILFGPGGQLRALYRVGTTTYAFLTDAQKAEVARALMAAVIEAQADGSIWRVCRSYPADHYGAQAGALFDRRHGEAELWAAHLAGHERLIGALRPREVEVYIAFGLPEPAEPAAVLSEARRALWRLGRAVERAAGVATAAPVTAAELDQVRARESQLYHRLTAAFGAIAIERARTREIQWLLARASCRGLGEPALDQFWRPRALSIEASDGAAFRPLRSVVERAASARITRARAHLEVESEHGTCYQAALVLGALPEHPVWPGAQCELMFTPLEGLLFGVDAVLHWRYRANEAARRDARRRTLDVDNTVGEEAHGVLGASWTGGETRYLARELQAYLDREDHPPILTGALQLIVGAGDADELDRRVSEVRDAYRPLTVHRPTGLQRQLYYEHLPRCGSAVSDWDDPLTVEQLGAMVPVATTQTGSDRGPYIGYTPITRRVVKFDTTESARESTAAAVLLAGGLGSGKTVSAQAIAVSALLRGSRVVDIDPKPDHGFHKYAPIAELVERFDLAPGEGNRGQLDPMRVPLIEAREEAAFSYYEQLLGRRALDVPDAEQALIGAIRACIDTGAWGSLAVIERLDAGGASAQGLARGLRSYVGFGLATLAFGAPQSDDIAAQAGLTSVRAHALELPDAGQPVESYSRRQRVSVATLGLLADYALRLCAGDRDRNKVIVFDEAWFLLASSQGRGLFERLVRMGRAMNAVILIATQRIADIGELEQLVGTFMIFGQRTDTEARRALQLLGLPDPSEQMLARVQGYRDGLCLMRDVRGRLAEVQFHLEPELLAAFDTSLRPTGG